MYKILAVLLVAAIAAHAAPIDSLRLRFKISARDLADKDSVGDGDPYIEVYYTEDGKKEEIKLGRTATLTNTKNPDFGDVFTFDFVRSKRQRLSFKVYDHDNLREDDKLGLAYTDVADFVDRGQHLNVNLNKKGYLILDTVDPVVTPSPVQVAVPGTVVQPVVPVAQLAPVTQIAGGQVIYSANIPMKLKFKLSARDLPDKDKVGATDPFVEIYSTEGASTKQTKVGQSAVINDNNNPSWGETFEFQYDPIKQQKWYFELKDSDYGDTDGVGKVWVTVSDYVSKGQKLTVNLSKKGTLTIESTEPVAAVAPSAVLQPGQQQQYVVQPVQPVQQIIQPVQPILVQPVAPLAPVVPVPAILKFKLSARGLDDKDGFGTSDPYVKVYYKQGSDKEVLIGNTKKFQDQENADWPDIFEFSYNPSLSPKFRFLVLDEDTGLSDDELGQASVDVSEYVQKGESLTLGLKKGSLTVSKA